jgi:hypothetical protein
MAGSVPLVSSAVHAAPKDYTVPQAQEIIVLAVNASIDGTGAAGAFIPTLQLVAPDGTIMFSAIGSSVAAGASVDVSWFPGLNAGTGASTGSGLFWPVATTDAVENTTTYPNTLDGSGNYQALVLGGSQAALHAQAYSGDAFPSVVYALQLGNGWYIYFGDSTFDPTDDTKNAAIGLMETAGAGKQGITFQAYGSQFFTTGIDGNLGFVQPTLGDGARYGLSQGGPHVPSTVSFTAGRGAPTIGGNVGDAYWQQDGGTAPFYVCTVAGVAGAATWAALTAGGGGGGGPTIIRGEIAANGTINVGTGFSNVRTAPGQHTVTFTAAFPATPVVVAGINDLGAFLHINAENVATTGFNAVIADASGSVNADGIWSFIAIQA